MGFPLSAKFTSEVLATCFAIFLGTSVVANELLPSTKGHGQGYYSTVFGFTFAFVVSGTWFGHISAQMNPAMFFYLAIRNELEEGWLEFVVGSAGSLLGGFLGGCLTFLYWAPHFWTVPLPQDPDPVSRLIHGHPDALSSDAGRLASAFGDNSRPDAGNTIKDEAIEFGRNIISGGPSSRKLSVDNEQGNGNNANHNVDLTFGNENMNNDARESERESLFELMEQERKLRAESVGGSDFFFANINRLSNITEDSMTNSTSTGGTDIYSVSRNVSNESLTHLAKTHEENDIKFIKSVNNDVPFTFLQDSPGPTPTHRRGSNQSKVTQQDKPLNTRTVDPDKKRKSMQVRIQETGKKLKEKLHLTKKIEEQRKFLDAAFEAAIRADQSAKLSIFCTRPAKYNRLANFLQETAGTFYLIFGLKMLDFRLAQDNFEADVTSPYTQGILATFFIIALALGLGGTTGFAVNPARDFGPRIAHFILPIAGKGESEWHYGWVPLFAPFVGAAIAAGAMECMETLYASKQ
jgi:glycerol uptake facilitator-like aquaporin